MAFFRLRATYKRGLATLEDQIVKYKEHEVFFSEEIALLKRSIVCKSAKDLNEEFKEHEVNEYGPRDSSLKPTTGCDKESDNSKEYTDDSLEQHQMSDTETSSFESPLKVDKDWKEIFFYPANHVESVNQIEKSVKRTVRYTEMYRSQRPRGNQRNWNGQKSNQLGCNFVFNTIYGSFDHIQYNCPNQQRKRIVSGNNYNKKDNDYYSKTSHSSAHKHMAPRAVLMKTGLKSVNTARPVNTVRAKGFNAVKPSVCWVWRPIKPNGASL
ncbi:hypothetical protein Tco_0934481 [Tanacetum coccineum]